MIQIIGTGLWRGIYAGAVGFGAMLSFAALTLIAVSLGALIGLICSRFGRKAGPDE